MIPIIVGFGVTIVALTAKATIETVSRCRRLTNFEIARMNGIYLRNVSNGGTFWDRFYSKDPDMAIGGFQTDVDVNEALDILGLSKKDVFNISKIKQRHREMIMQNHPDRGGSEYLAMKINKAKEVLIK